MITHEQSEALCNLIDAYVEAAVDASWAGSSDPGDAKEIRKNAKEALDALNQFIATITAVPTVS